MELRQKTMHFEDIEIKAQIDEKTGFSRSSSTVILWEAAWVLSHFRDDLADSVMLALAFRVVCLIFKNAWIFL